MPVSEDVRTTSHRRTHYVEALLAVMQASQVLQQLQPLATLGNRVISVLEETLNYPGAAVLLIDEEQGRLMPLAVSKRAHSEPAHRLQHDISQGFRLGEGITGWVAVHGETVRVGDVRTDERYIMVSEEVRSELCVPIRFGDRVIGVLDIESPRLRAFSSVDEQVLETVAAQIGTAIQNARLYEQVQRDAAELEQRIAERTAELVRLNVQLIEEITERKRVQAELEQVIEGLDAFSSNVAHDIRGPLQIIVGFSQVMAEDLSSLSDEEVRQYLHQIAQYAYKTTNIVEDLLVLARVRSSVDVEPSPVDMNIVMEDVLKRLAFQIEQRRPELVIPDRWPLALGYAPWIEAVWVNYLSNAIKYGGSPPQIELGAKRQPDGMIRFWVRDNGAGIPAERLDDLFSPYTRLAPASLKGEGLGLAIAQRIISRLGGRVSVDSEVGKGSTFSFTLRAAPEGDLPGILP
jgi:signal transduction histidine kinase